MAPASVEKWLLLVAQSTTFFGALSKVMTVARGPLSESSNMLRKLAASSRISFLYGFALEE